MTGLNVTPGSCGAGDQSQGFSVLVGQALCQPSFICTFQLHFQERIWLTAPSNQITEEANTLSPRRRFTGEASAPKMVC